MNLKNEGGKKSQQLHSTIIKKIITILNLLQNKYHLKKDLYRELAYRKAINSLKKNAVYVNKKGELTNKIEGIGKSIKDKIKQIIKTGTVKELKNKVNSTIIKFKLIHGVGDKVAEKWYKKGYRHYSEIKKYLTPVQLLSLKHIKDTSKRIPRSTMKYYNKIIMKIMKKLKIKGEVSGSFKRKLKTSGDIDVVLINNVIPFLKELKNYSKYYILSKGNSKYALIIKFNKKKQYHRMDIEITTAKSYPFAILYFTGSKEFNIGMRSQAKKLGYDLNQLCLKKNNHCIFLKTEKEIFKKLKMKYIPPKER